ncbi:vesicular glutamate transporter 1-like [Aphidius gifuensis]|uniref:vesicular glutamate transporter 1-like n=1 Tax=Aphidius gifuensis TaxID=684658 RepID=UPI001CDD6910|nr:vesicular glutamate transporter 1-like [Aphidius gifuensis]
MAAAGYFCADPTILMVCIIISYSAGGFAVSGFLVNCLDIAPQHASVLMGMGNTIGTISGVISPSLTGYIVKSKSADEWKIVLMIVGIIHLMGALIYGTFASGERQKWAIDLNKQESRRKFLQTQDTDDNAD